MLHETLSLQNTTSGGSTTTTTMPRQHGGTGAADEMAAGFKCYDLSALPLKGILARREKTMVLLVNRDGRELVVKLHQGKGTASSHMPLTNEIPNKLPRIDAFSNELSLLINLQSQVSGLVRIFGWGEAQTYKGIVLEALKGPTLGNQLYKPTFNPSSHLQLLYRLSWASQLACIFCELHQMSTFHGDVRADNFAFRTPPSSSTFGRLAMYDLDKASKMAKHPRFLMRAQTVFYDHLREFAEVRCSPYFPSYDVELFAHLQRFTDAYLLCPDGKNSSSWSPSSRSASWSSPSIASHGSAVHLFCDHRPTKPPPPVQLSSSTNSSIDELASMITVGPPCRKEHSCENSVVACCEEKSGSSGAYCAANSSKSSPRVYSGQTTPSSVAGTSVSLKGSLSCLCLSCECKEGRTEVADLALLIVECLGMYDPNRHQLKDCVGCHRRTPLTDQNLRKWVDAVGAYLNGLVLIRSHGTQIIAVSDVVHIRSKSLDGLPSLQALIKLRHAWSSLGNKIVNQLYSLVHRALSQDVMSRPTAREFDDALGRIFNALHRFTERFIPHLPAAGGGGESSSSASKSAMSGDSKSIRHMLNRMTSTTCRTPSSSGY